MKKVILELIEQMRANKLNFPSTWSDTRRVNDDISFRTYMNDKRDYISIVVYYPKYKLDFTINGDDEISINGTLSKIHTLSEVVKALQMIVGFRFNKEEDIKKMKEEIKNKRNQKKIIDSEIKNIKILISNNE